VSSIVETIYTDLKTQILAALPARYESRYVWDPARNPSTANSSIFMIRPQGATSANTTNRAITLDHSFDVILSTSYKNIKETDTPLRNAIFALHEDHETIYRFAFLSNFGIPRVLLVSTVDIAEPDIDEENGVVSIVATYTIKYRTELT
jgi:hypothetical protein